MQYIQVAKQTIGLQNAEAHWRCHILGHFHVSMTPCPLRSWTMTMTCTA